VVATQFGNLATARTSATLLGDELAHRSFSAWRGLMVGATGN